MAYNIEEIEEETTAEVNDVLEFLESMELEIADDETLHELNFG